MTNIDKIRNIVSTHQAKKIDGVMIDTFSAAMVVNQWDRLSNENRIKLEGLPIDTMVKVCLKMITRHLKEIK